MNHQTMTDTSAGSSPSGIVHIVDDDRDTRAALGRLLEAAGFTVALWATADEFLAALQPQQPGCLLLDVRLPGMSGLELQARLRETGAMLPVIAMSGYADVAIAVRSMKQGAFDFVQKPLAPGVLLATVAAALAHDAERRARRVPQEHACARLARLSTRERNILDGIIAGRRNKCIAAGLGITESTVEVHRRHLMLKLGARTLTDLVRLHHAAVAGDDPDPPVVHTR